MRVAGHVVLGLAAFQTLCTFYGYSPHPVLYIFAVFGSLLPDIDHQYSRIGKSFPSLSRLFAVLSKHRGITHSLVALIILMFVMFQYGQMGYGTVGAVCIGYLSHLLGDFCTHGGIPFFWPFKYRSRMPVFHFHTGSKTEYVLTLSLVLLVAYHWVY